MCMEWRLPDELCDTRDFNPTSADLPGLGAQLWAIGLSCLLVTEVGLLGL